MIIKYFKKMQINNEKLLDKSPLLTIDETVLILKQMRNSICKIVTKKHDGTGFFCKKSNKKLFITNNHVINEEIIKDKNIIKIKLNDNEITKNIKIKDYYTSIEYDTTIIEINDNDENINYLEIDDDIFDEDTNIVIKSIYIIQYPKYGNEQKAAVSYGKFKEIKDKYNITYYCSTDYGSSGSPILNLSNKKIIGIHKSSVQNSKNSLDFNTGTLLKYPINEYFNKIKEKEREKKENERKEKEKKEKEKKEREREYEKAEDDCFNYGELNKYLNKIDNKKQNLILFSTGSYNPIHRMHIQILNTAYNQLKGKYNVICNFISPSADCYVASEGNILIPFEERCKMIYEAIEYYLNREIYDLNFNILLHKWEGSHRYYIDLPEVISEIQYKINKYYKKYNIRVLYVCGMDYYLKYINSLRQNVVAIDRKPYVNNKYKTNEKNYIYVLKDEKIEPYSSTEIRKSFFQTGDLKKIYKLTFPNVAKMIIDFYEKETKKYQMPNYHE